jgi:hypothetical protein
MHASLPTPRPILSGNPCHPELNPWLASLEPRAELVIRYAMRALFPRCRDDQPFDRRIDELERLMKPSATLRESLEAEASALQIKIGADLLPS